MEEEGSPIAEEELNSDLPGLEKNKFKDFLNKNKIVVISIGASIVILLLVIIIILASIGSNKGSSKDNKKKEENALGRIECIYEIETTSKETQIISNDFSQGFEIFIKINGQILKFSKSFKFSKMGEQNLTFLLYDTNISLDKMFKDVIQIKRANFITSKNIKIKGMESTFENCVSLKNVNFILTFHKLIHQM